MKGTFSGPTRVKQFYNGRGQKREVGVASRSSADLAPLSLLGVLEELLIGVRVHQLLKIAGICGLHLDDPAGAIGILVNGLRSGDERLVHLDHLAARRRKE